MSPALTQFDSPAARPTSVPPSPPTRNPPSPNVANERLPVSGSVFAVQLLIGSSLPSTAMFTVVAAVPPNPSTAVQVTSNAEPAPRKYVCETVLP